MGVCVGLKRERSCVREGVGVCLCVPVCIA